MRFFFRHTRKERRGQFLIEAIVAVGVLVVGLLGIFALLSRSLSLGRTVTDNYAATYLAAEGIEVVKNIIDGNIIQGLPWISAISDGDFEIEYDTVSLLPFQDRFLGFDPVTSLYSYAGGETTRFKRVLRIALIGSPVDELQVNSIVSWTSGGGNFSVDLEDHFFNWRP
jgi:hypothetical protein